MLKGIGVDNGWSNLNSLLTLVKTNTNWAKALLHRVSDDIFLQADPEVSIVRSPFTKSTGISPLDFSICRK